MLSGLSIVLQYRAPVVPTDPDYNSPWWYWQPVISELTICPPRHIVAA